MADGEVRPALISLRDFQPAVDQEKVTAQIITFIGWRDGKKGGPVAVFGTDRSDSKNHFSILEIPVDRFPKELANAGIHNFPFLETATKTYNAMGRPKDMGENVSAITSLEIEAFLQLNFSEEHAAPHSGVDAPS